MFKFFKLSWSHYEEYVPYFFMGPLDCSKDKFNEICKSFLPDSCANIIAAKNNNEDTSLIGWDDLVEGIVPFLEKNGFTLIEAESCDFFGGRILDLRDEQRSLPKTVYDNIIFHNEMVNMNYKYKRSDEDDWFV